MSGSKTGTWATALILALAVAAAFGLGTVLRQALPVGPTMAHAEETAAAEYDGPWAVAERQITDNEERGAIRVGEEVVLEIQTVAGGLTGYERALIVSKRLNDALAAGVKPNQIHSAQTAGMYVVQAGPTTLITVTNPEAERQNTTPPQLAALWAQSLARALGGEPGPPVVPTTTTPGEGETTPLETDWTPPEPYKDKLVPIISVLQGVKVGVARVNGPASKVDQVQAVAQLETDFRKVLTINIYVPISTEVPGQKLARVQGVGLTGVADIRIRL